MKCRSVLVVALVVLSMLLAPLGFVGAADLPPSPVLMELSPDRGDIGHEITFQGKGFLPQAATGSRVYFGSDLVVDVTPQSDKVISVTIPTGAETGWVWVGITVPDGNGGEVELTSNPLKLMVIRQEINMIEVPGPGNIHAGLFGGNSDGTFLAIPRSYRKQGEQPEKETGSRSSGTSDDLVSRVSTAQTPNPPRGTSANNKLLDRSTDVEIWFFGHDGSKQLIMSLGSRAFLNTFARDPISGFIFGIEDFGAYQTLNNLTLNQTIATWSVDDSHWRGTVIDFDPFGNLIISGQIGNYWYPEFVPVNVWRFTPAEWGAPNANLVLDPDSKSALLPPGTDSGAYYGWYRDMAVSGDGTIYIVDRDDQQGHPPNIWRIPARDGTQYERIQMPSGDEYDGYWFVAPNPCGGGAFAANPDLHTSDPNDPGPVEFYSVDDQRLIASVDYFTGYGGLFSGFQTDALGNLFAFVHEDDEDNVQHWLSPAILEGHTPHFYKNFECHTDYDCGECDPEGGSPNDCVGAPVRLSNGNMRYTERDQLPTGLPLLAVRTYDSAEDLGNDSAGVFGRGWHSAFDAALTGDAAGATIHIRTEANRQVEFVQLGGTYVQTRPSGGRGPGSLSFDGLYYRYLPAGESLERLYDSSGVLSGFNDIETGRFWSIGYDAEGLPETVSDSWSDWQWVIGCENGRISSIAAPGLSFSYIYSDDGALETVNADGLPWRSYYYDGPALTEVRDGDGAVLEMHAYEPTVPYRAISSRTPGEDIASVEYDLQTGTLRPIALNKGESVTRVTNIGGYSTEYYTRPVGGRRRTVEVRGDCGCGSGDFAAYVYDGLGHVVREQRANGSITVRSWDHNGHLRSVGSGYFPLGCEPSEQNNYCWVESVDELYKIDLDNTHATTTTYSYEDSNWPDKATEICRPSVLETGAQTCTTLTLDPSTGQLVRRSQDGWTWNGEINAMEETTRSSERHLYAPGETAVFDPVSEASSLGIGVSFEPQWAALPQPEGALKETLGPRHFDPNDPAEDRSLFVYYPIDPSVPSGLRGRLAARMDPVGEVSFFDDYDDWGHLTRTIDSRGVTTEFEYDSLGRLHTQTLRGLSTCDEIMDPLCHENLQTTMTYASTTNRRTYTVAPTGQTGKFQYDEFGRQKQVFRGDADAVFKEKVKYALNEVGAHTREVVKVKDGTWQIKKKTSFTYDERGRLWQTLYPDGTSDENTYGPAGELLKFKDAVHEQPNVLYSYDGQGRLREVRQLENGSTDTWIVTSYGYDSAGNLTSVTDGNNMTTTYLVDDFGQSCRIDSPATGVTKLNYNAAGQMVEKVDGRGVSEIRHYDSGGKLMDSQFSDGSSTESRSFTYEHGRRVGATSQDSTESWDYGRRGEVLRYVRDGVPLIMQYDKGGAMTFYGRTPGEEGVQYTLDWASRPVQAHLYHPGWHRQPIVWTAQYLPYGPLEYFSAGLHTLNLGVPFQRFEYDLRYRQESSVFGWTEDGIESQVYSRSREFDGLGNLVEVNDELVPDRSWRFSYDDAGRLRETKGPIGGLEEIVYELDAVGNRTQRVRSYADGGVAVEDYGYDPRNGLLSTVTETPPGQSPVIHNIDHDDAGNLRDDDLSTYGYNPSGTLAWQGLGQTGSRVGFEYDSGSRRIATLSDPGGPNEARREHFLLPDGRPYFVEEASGDRIWYIYLGAHLVATVNESPSGDHQDRFVISDHLGYPEMVMDKAGNTLWSADHLPFGETVDESGSENDPLLRYPGQWAVPEAEALGLSEVFYNGFRWYMPEWGRYSQADPLTNGFGKNPFAYAAGRPLTLVDVFGLSACGAWTEEFSFDSTADQRTDEGWWEPGWEKIWFLNNWIPAKFGGGSIPESLVGKCCKIGFYSRYEVSKTVYLRRCDCCASDRDFEMTDDPTIEPDSIYRVPPRGPCNAKYQYGQKIEWGDVLKWNYTNDLERERLQPSQCVPIPRIGGKCPPPSGA